MNQDLNRRNFLGMTGAGLLGGIAGAAPFTPPVVTVGEQTSPSGSGARPHNNERRNLVIFLPDETRADSLACYGNPVTRTPNFDRLAKDGTRFANCHVQFPVCGASRCSLLTGWPTSVRGHRSLFYYLRPEEPNLFRYLRRAGYDVFWYGKNDALAAQCFYDSVTEWSETLYQGTHKSDPPLQLTPGALTMLYSPMGDRRQTNDYACVQKAIEILERKEHERPFCIFLPLIGAHPPYTAPKDFYNMYSPSEVPAPIPPGLKNKPSFQAGMREMYGLEMLNEATLRKIRAIYYGQVSYTDWLLGEVMEALDRTNSTKNTALFLLSDHGDYAGDFGLVEKWPSGLEDCLTHVPLIARVPGGAPGVVAEDMVELYDVMQTVLDLAGTTATHTHFSRSLLPQMAGLAGDPNRAAFAEGGYNVYEPQCFEPLGSGGGEYVGKISLQNEQPITVSRSAMIRTRTHKLIMRPQDRSELYSYRDDPQERNNLYGTSGATAVQAELQEALLTHFLETSGIAPYDKDSRECPPFYPTRKDMTPDGWQEKILDKK
ncbi:MAG: sulfatase-like hydrolase/transferase [Acidobacteriota bacterium]